MFVSVIIPVHNGGVLFQECLQALSQTLYQSWEGIVVDDGSTDDSARTAEAMGMRVIRLNGRNGPAYARNVGAHASQGDVLFFVDADVRVQPGTVGHVVATLQAHPHIAACFGSYDTSPKEANFLSQYRNLLHHFVHQQSHSEASTFWSGCGAVYRTVFGEMGGFDDERFPTPSIEDIELGYRLRAAGYQIRLEKLLQVQHMKHWDARTMLITDIRSRAIPWSELILQGGVLPNDLNLQTAQRLSTVAVFALLGGIGLVLFSSWGWVLAFCAVSFLLWLNRTFYAFLRQQRGVLFMMAAIPWHGLYFLYSGLSFAWVLGRTLTKRQKIRRMGVDEQRPLTIPSSTVNQPAHTPLE